jgi:hypothetical protein
MTRPTLGGRMLRRVLVVSFSAAAGLLAAALPAIAQRGPAPTPTGLSPEVLSLACAPALTYEEPAVALRVSGGQEAVRRLIHAPGDLVTINAGTNQGIAVGQEYYTRRPLPAAPGRISGRNPGTIRTTGWIRVWAVEEEMSLATISHACETVDVGDYLEPFGLPSVPRPSSATGVPERGNYGHVLSGQDRRTSFGLNDYLLIDRGSSQGVAVGARFVIYRDKRTPGNFLFEIGEGYVVDVKADTATLHVLRAIDAITAGDYVGMRK